MEKFTELLPLRFIPFQAWVFNFISEECFKSRNGGLVSVGKTKYLKEMDFTTINIKGAEVNLWV